MIQTDVLILGGGLAGLSTAYHLQKLDRNASFLIAEKNRRSGGLAGSIVQDGFTFDHTGHLLHLHDPYGKKLILDLLQENVAIHDRSSWIFSHGAYTRYPFQANTFGLPEKVVDECVAGFMKTVHRPEAVDAKSSFKDWSLKTFGRGISKHFMYPYNEKLWRVPLSKMTTEWQGRFIPKPAPEEVLYGALTDQKKFFGYNASFRYPVQGGSQALSDALAARVSQIQYGRRVSAVDLHEKVAVVDGLGEIGYRRLVNTMPLAAFLDLCAGHPEKIRSARGKLRWNTVYNLNIGINRPKISDKHWIYFPEKQFPFYRAGFASNFSPNLAPKGSTSMYIEVSGTPKERVDLNRLEGRILDGLRSCGILKGSDKILTRLWITIPCAYVLYDFNRTSAVNAIFPYLNGLGVESIGRFGGWKYSFMEEAIMDGKRCAERLTGRILEGPKAENSEKELQPLK